MQVKKQMLSASKNSFLQEQIVETIEELWLQMIVRSPAN